MNEALSEVWSRVAGRERFLCWYGRVERDGAVVIHTLYITTCELELLRIALNQSGVIENTNPELRSRLNDQLTALAREDARPAQSVDMSTFYSDNDQNV